MSGWKMLLWVILISIYSVFLQCTSSLGFLATSCRLRAGGQWIHGSMREGRTPFCSQGSPLQTCWVLTISSTLVSSEQHLFMNIMKFTLHLPRGALECWTPKIFQETSCSNSSSCVFGTWASGCYSMISFGWYANPCLILFGERTCRTLANPGLQSHCMLPNKQISAILWQEIIYGCSFFWGHIQYAQDDFWLWVWSDSKHML